ncbi:hypothetical protein GALMADRAFT_215166 [Galerina marginata CBS 339.88]|uniref:YMC020W-like alpha/beta hydrolase domain-containing protein n=1 Tax=Galerina marginata (strain CBS 339.88) TaxID=685588 RepID=A0A067SHN7_GALM3|nr:hypothetical protein GALMADRAFT_215166 [Galerina marginata CBS 339.88]
MVKALGYGAGGGNVGAITAGDEDEVKRDENGMELMEEGVRGVEREVAGNTLAAGVLDATKFGSIKEANSTNSASYSLMKFVSGVLFAKDAAAAAGVGGVAKNGRERVACRLVVVLGENGVDGGMYVMKDVLRGCRRVVVISVHGWYPGVIRTVFGEPTGTSTKFANMTEQALQEFESEHGVQLEKVTKTPLEGDETIDREANAGRACCDFTKPRIPSAPAGPADGYGGGFLPSSIGLGAGGAAAPRKVQRLCGIHLGPLRYLSSSTLVGPYLQYFESTAARELFEFQNTESSV